MTLCPRAFKISAKDEPKNILRKCPKCNGLFVFGDGYSIITDWPEELGLSIA